MTKRAKINKKISEAMREAHAKAIPKLKDAARQGMRAKKQYEHAGISDTTYYRWLQEDKELRDELTQLLLDFRKTKIREAAMIGAPILEQRRHANNMSELEYSQIMEDDPEFFEEVEMIRQTNLKLWARKNIATSIQEKGNVGDSWRFLEHMDKDMNKVRVDLNDDPDPDNDKLIDEFEEQYRKNLQNRIKKLALKKANANH